MGHAVGLGEGRRPSARARGYTAVWDHAAKAYRVEHPLCLGCEAIGLIEPATVVDHVDPHRGDQGKFWDRANWQPSCDWHHSAIKPVLERMRDDGIIGIAGLKLDSPEAKALSRRFYRHTASVGRDGW